jgi:hypothetical protein
MIEVILTRLESIHNRLRTDEVQGHAYQLPEEGRGFSLVGAPLKGDADFRLITTSRVKEIRHHTEEGSLEFWTENSHYGLQILNMDTQGKTH